MVCIGGKMFLLTEENKNQPVCAHSPHFKWGEILQNYMTVKGYEKKNFNVIEDPEVMYNAVVGAMMLEEYRAILGHQISGNSGHRPELYNDVVLPENGYNSDRLSDHKYKDSFAFDSDVPPTYENIQKWEYVCDQWGVSPSLGLYPWGMHLGWRRNQPPRQWDYR